MIKLGPLKTVRRDTSLAEAARLLLDHRYGCLPVVGDAGRLCGIVTESNFAARERGVPFSTLFLPQVFNEWMPPEGIERLYQAARTTRADDIMSTDPATVSEETSVEEVIEQMRYRDINHVPVIRDGIPVGIISRHELLQMMVVEAERGQRTIPRVEGR